MMTSQQIAAQIAQQNDQFMGVANYSQSISAQMPQLNQGGIGSYGGGSPAYNPYPQMPYGVNQRPGFSYSGSPMGYGMSNAIGGGAMSAISGAGHAVAGLGAMGMIPGLGFLDPIGGAMQGFMGKGIMGRLAGGGLLGGALGAGVGLVGGMAVNHVLGSMVGGAQEQAGIERVMGQYNFMSGARGGRGFSRNDSKAVGDMVRHMAMVPEMMTSVSELTRIMEKMGQMGVMQGVRDAGEFQRRFKETLSTLKDLSKIFGTSMEGASQYFQEARMSGMYTKQDILKNAMQRQVTSAVTGMNQQQVGQVQYMGSQMSFAMGGTRATGARHARRTAETIGMANQMGIISNEDIMEMTGMSGPEGTQELTSTLTQAAYRMAQGNLGRLSTLALGEVEGGKYTGRMDENLVDQYRRGELSKSELFKLARQKSRGRGAKLSYMAHQKKLTAEMAGAVGVEGLSMELKEILGEHGWKNPDAVGLVMKRFGIQDEREVEMIQKYMEKLPEIEMGTLTTGRQAAQAQVRQNFMKENFSWDAIKRKTATRISNVVTEPLKKFGADLRHRITSYVDEYIDEVTGQYTYEVNERVAKLGKEALGGSQNSRAELRSLMDRTGFGTTPYGQTRGSPLAQQYGYGIQNRGADMSMGAMGSAIQWMTGAGPTAGQEAASIMAMTGGRTYETTDAGAARARGGTILDSRRTGGGAGALKYGAIGAGAGALATGGTIGTVVGGIGGAAYGYFSGERTFRVADPAELQRTARSLMNLQETGADSEAAYAMNERSSLGDRLQANLIMEHAMHGDSSGSVKGTEAMVGRLTTTYQGQRSAGKQLLDNMEYNRWAAAGGKGRVGDPSTNMGYQLAYTAAKQLGYEKQMASPYQLALRLYGVDTGSLKDAAKVRQKLEKEITADFGENAPAALELAKRSTGTMANVLFGRGGPGSIQSVDEFNQALGQGMSREEAMKQFRPGIYQGLAGLSTHKTASLAAAEATSRRIVEERGGRKAVVGESQQRAMDANPGLAAATSDAVRLDSMSARGFSNLSDADKEMLKRTVGDDWETKIKDPTFKGDLVKFIQLAKEGKPEGLQKLIAYRGALDLESLQGMQKQLGQYGQQLGAQVEQYRYELEDMEKAGGPASEVVKKLRATPDAFLRAGSEEGAARAMLLTGEGADWGGAARDIAQLRSSKKPEDREAAKKMLKMFPQYEAAVTAYEKAGKILGKSDLAGQVRSGAFKGVGVTEQQALETIQDVTGMGREVEGKKVYETDLKVLEKDKRFTGMSDEQKQEVQKRLAQQAGASVVAGGAASASQHANEADVAKSLADFSSNVNKLADIVSGMNPKTPGAGGSGTGPAPQGKKE